MSLGLYISVPFCRTKCSYCNFASGIYSSAKFDSYIDRVMSDMERAEAHAAGAGAAFERVADSVYLGGGTPSLLAPAQLERLFAALLRSFEVAADAEITVECAPGTLSPALLESFVRCGVNRVSLGVQSFIDDEAKAVGRLHSRAIALSDIASLRSAGIANINADLIAGLPHQTPHSWRESLDQLIASGVPHASVYMLEVDEDSRLGRELIAGGARYHAHFVPDEGLITDLYISACERLEKDGLPQYEISNFAHKGAQSRHNMKYWTRQPYLGFGIDAHSMLRAGAEHAQAGVDALRFSTPDTLEEFLALPQDPIIEVISRTAALEETFFLGLRLNRGVSLTDVASQFGKKEVAALDSAILDVVEAELATLHHGTLRLTARGRLLSNEVFERFVSIGSFDELRPVTGAAPGQPRPGIAISGKIH